MKKPRWLSGIKAIGWDLDGTLYPASVELSSSIHKKYIETVAKKCNLDLLKAKKEFEKRYKKIGSHTKTLNSFGVDGNEFFRKFWDEVRLEDFIKIDKGIEEMFGRLSKKRHFIITNSNTHKQIKRKLSLIGIDYGLFEVVVSSFDVGVNKPSLKPFMVALKKLKIEPSEVMYIGDREKTDIIPAKRAGMRTCLVWGESREADISFVTVYDVGELFS